jgi:hypothetical protein
MAHNNQDAIALMIRLRFNAMKIPMPPLIVDRQTYHLGVEIPVQASQEEITKRLDEFEHAVITYLDIIDERIIDVDVDIGNIKDNKMHFTLHYTCI